MSLDSGTRIGPYEIRGPLGAGGMGEVYRARDTRLDRDVAIKALPAAFAADAERLARFEREAKTLASLNHPGIAAIYGLEDGDGAPFLVLELVEGESLARRLARGPLSVRETLDTGVRIAAALEAAHERGVVHRDLKPGNVMLAASGAVKVLDFGLAKSATLEGVTSSIDLSASPTVALNATGAGTLLGTAAYMSPEQARGKPVDRRTDVWAFGCVLYECLTGRQAFAGETASDVIARTLEREPDWSALPGATPPRLRDLVRRCLVKDASDRPRDIGDLGRELAAIVLERSSPSSLGPPAATPSLAVLYFENLANDPESEYFCAGITEDILTDLSKIRGLRVASRNAVARYRGAPADIPRVAAELGVQAVLEGSVRRAGDRVRITAQLINAGDGFQLWAERYDRRLADVFDVQEEIASSIAAALRVALTPAESENLVQHRPSDARAYDLYLKGREVYGRYRLDSLRQALELFQQATQIDPNYALAWAGIADTYGQMCQWGAPEPGKLVALGLEAARRAIAIDPELPDAHKSHALVLRFAGDRDASRAALVRSLETNPRFIPAIVNLAVHCFSDADLAGTERLVRRALEIDPQDAFSATWMGWLTRMTGRLDESLAWADRLRGLSDDPFYVTACWYYRGRAHLDRGDLAAAERTVRDAVADGAQADNLRVIEAAIAAHAGRRDEARALVSGLTEAPGLNAGSLTLLAGVATRLGEHETGRKLMERSLVQDLAPTIVRLEHELHPLLDRPPLAPPRRDATLVWPLEAPMIDLARFRLFREVRIGRATPEGSDLLAG